MVDPSGPRCRHSPRSASRRWSASVSPVLASFSLWARFRQYHRPEVDPVDVVRRGPSLRVLPDPVGDRSSLGSLSAWLAVQRCWGMSGALARSCRAPVGPSSRPLRSPASVGLGLTVVRLRPGPAGVPVARSVRMRSRFSDHRASRRVRWCGFSGPCGLRSSPRRGLSPSIAAPLSSLPCAYRAREGCGPVALPRCIPARTPVINGACLPRLRLVFVFRPPGRRSHGGVVGSTPCVSTPARCRPGVVRPCPASAS